MIKISNLSKFYKSGKVKALDGVELSINAGEVIGLIGPNGAGKTTLMQCMLGLLRPSSGEILINGFVPNHLAVKKITAFLPERPLFEGWMTARLFLRYHHMLSGQPDKTAATEVEKALNEVQLQESARDRRIKTYSKGMLQRLGLAQMLIGKPSLCFLDEPTSGLDPISRNIVRDTILKWKADGATVILNSHHLDEVERVCDRVAFIQQGHIDLVQSTRGLEGETVAVLVKWSGPADAEARLNEIASHSSFGLELLSENSARFKLRGRQEMPVLIRALINAQMDIEEVFEDRAHLEKLFTASQSRDAG
jgi:ABC-2 type transport system ATP-binding protein